MTGVAGRRTLFLKDDSAIKNRCLFVTTAQYMNEFFLVKNGSYTESLSIERNFLVCALL